MPKISKRERADLERLRLPELQQRYAELTGVSTRSPNKTFLLRRIVEELESQRLAEPAGRSEARPAGESQDMSAEDVGMPEGGALAPGAADPAEDRVESTAPGAASASIDDALVDDEPTGAIQACGAEAASGVEEPTVVSECTGPTGVEPAPEGDLVESTAPGAASMSIAEVLAEAQPTGAVRAGASEGPTVASADTGRAEMEPAPHDDASDRREEARPETPKEGADREPGRHPEGAAEDPGKAMTRVPRGALTGLTIDELQAKYREVVGRATGSSDKDYLMWKIREAVKGRIPTGPRASKARTSQGDDIMVLPLRLPATTVDAMDRAWRSLGIRTRMDFLRDAIRSHLAQLGAQEAAALVGRIAADEPEATL